MPAVSASERYELRHPLASGGMATVYLGRMVTHAGLSRTVAIKRLHPHVAGDPAFAAMFFDEARLAMRIQHPNVVATFDVAEVNGEQLLVMDYVHGESLFSLMRRAREREVPIPPPVLASILGGVLTGLHAAHEAKSESGEPLGIVHRDVSPQNVIVGVDGVARVLDFGVAKAVGRMQTTETGQVKGKLAYMAPEQMTAAHVDRRADLFAAAALLWEGLANQRLFDGDGPAQIVSNVLSLEIPPPSGRDDAVSRALDRVALRGLSRHRDERFATAREMAIALEEACPPATARAVETWLHAVATDSLATRSALLAEVESASSRGAHLRGGIDTSGVVPFDARSGPEDDTLSATDSALGPPSRRKPGRAIASGVAVLILGATLALGVGLVRRGGPAEATNATNATFAPAAVAEAASASAALAPLPIASAAPAVSDAGSVTPMAVVAATVPPARNGRSTPSAPVRAAPRPRAGNKPDCSNPVTVTADGIRMPRPECF